MGLDMSAYKRFPGAPEDETGELQCWRKHPDLHGWMNAIYTDRGGKEEFNIIELQLFPADIDQLEQDLVELPHTEGFFFGASQPSDRELDIEFIAASRKAFAEGFHVFYNSWW